MSIVYFGIDWDYYNLEGIGYDSTTLDEPYATWLYSRGNAVCTETETINFNETYSLKPNKSVQEVVVKIKDTGYRGIRDNCPETITVSDDYSRKVNERLSETLNVEDVGNREIKRKNYESHIFAIDEARFIAVNEDGEETIGEQIELGGSINLFDFEFSNTPLDKEDFTNWTNESAPINHNELRPFIPGEYEYTNAYAGFKLSINPIDGRFGVVNGTVYVDVEDTVEKGTSTATAGALTQVAFSKTFYTKPHVMTSLLYSRENCYVEVKEISVNGFKFGLKSTDTGQYLEGEIDWLADGY